MPQIRRSVAPRRVGYVARRACWDAGRVAAVVESTRRDHVDLNYFSVLFFIVGESGWGRSGRGGTVLCIQAVVSVVYSRYELVLLQA